TLTTSRVKVPDNAFAETQVETNGPELCECFKYELKHQFLKRPISPLTTSSAQVPDDASAEVQEETNGTVPLSNIAKNTSETLTSSTISGKVSNDTSATAEALQNLTYSRLFSETYFYGFCIANRCAFECSAVNQWSYWTPCSGVPGKSFEQRMRVIAFLDHDNTSCFMALEMRKCNMVKSVAVVFWPTSLILRFSTVPALSESQNCPSS
ncbi:conserved hypothetical protein, partial [Trichinella spiralis]|uniref:hypothetical protein n=1 Tax=Trichinella spiralis TaxID=6334 RepID=UPI0001EFDD08